MVHLGSGRFSTGLPSGLGVLFQEILWFMTTDSWQFGLGLELRVANVFIFFPIPHTAYVDSLTFGKVVDLGCERGGMYLSNVNLCSIHKGWNSYFMLLDEDCKPRSYACSFNCITVKAARFSFFSFFPGWWVTDYVFEKDQFVDANTET